MTIDQISDDFVRDLAALSPLMAVYLGLPSDRLLDDLSPDGIAEQAALVRRTLAAASQQPVDTAATEVAADVLGERLQLHLDRDGAGDFHSALNVIASPLQDVRMLFDLLPTEQRRGLRRHRRTHGRRAGGVRRLRRKPARGGPPWSGVRRPPGRQVRRAVRHLLRDAPATPGYFASIAAGSSRAGALAEELAAAAQVADAAYADLATFLRTELRPHAPERDAVGRERVRLGITRLPGGDHRPPGDVRLGMEGVPRSGGRTRGGVRAHRTRGPRPAEVADQLDGDPRYQVTGTDGLQRWMQQLSDDAVAELGRTHFDIPEPIRTLDCKIAPPGGTVGAYYTGPSDDLSRPGAMWWSVEAGREVFSTWREVTTVYHEGVPGHHLQIATSVYERESLNDFQRLAAGTSGHAEGWALYAERLMRELGYLDDDPILLGMLDAQLFRAARVVVDIGMHLELEIPAGTGFHEGERWTPELGLEFLLTRTVSDPKHAADEIDRYLGWPGQAPAYKVGERIWIAGRDAARIRHGDAFDPRAFHTQALRFGGMGLEPLADLLATI